MFSRGKLAASYDDVDDTVVGKVVLVSATAAAPFADVFSVA